ncbi:MAG: aldo/keto reductase [Candidatus Nomurabacteria bacterium]|nr:aldo/keto reductase [Candidatus Nomurabacteria bacterium]
MKKIDTDLILNTGAIMPSIGLGTWKSLPDKAGQAVLCALMNGYRHIDCAAVYRNEKEIGVSFKKVFEDKIRDREEVFITSKLWNSEHKKEDVRKACEATLSNLNLEYLDLYLMHWGVAIPHKETLEAGWTVGLDSDGVIIREKVSIRETWEAMEELVELGLVKAIGVSNFTTMMLVDLLSYAKIKPAVNQIELHPYLQQTELLEFCKRNGIILTGYSPLGSPGNNKDKGLPILVEDSIILAIASSHNKSPAQILIRWGIQRGTVVIPKSVTEERIKENLNVFDFELSGEEMNKIAELNKNFRFVNPYDWWKIPYFI